VAQSDPACEEQAVLVGAAVELAVVHPREQGAIDFTPAAAVEDADDTTHDQFAAARASNGRNGSTLARKSCNTGIASAGFSL
jgi:hypothetical protein